VSFFRLCGIGLSGEAGKAASLVLDGASLLFAMTETLRTGRDVQLVTFNIDESVSLKARTMVLSSLIAGFG